MERFVETRYDSKNNTAGDVDYVRANLLPNCTQQSDLPLPDARSPGHNALRERAVPIRARRRKAMSRRIGQNGTIEVRDGAYRGRWLEDVPGKSERVKRSVVLGFVKEMTKSEARRKL